MSQAKEKMRLTVELMRRGAVMLKESCDVCNGVQVRFRGRVYCTNHDDLNRAIAAREVSFGEVSEALKNMTLTKLKENIAILEQENEVSKQDALVSLIIKYVELLGKLPESAQRT